MKGWSPEEGPRTSKRKYSCFLGTAHLISKSSLGKKTPEKWGADKEAGDLLPGLWGTLPPHGKMLTLQCLSSFVPGDSERV